jgi:hypothetical protein
MHESPPDDEEETQIRSAANAAVAGDETAFRPRPQRPCALKAAEGGLPTAPLQWRPRETSQPNSSDVFALDALRALRAGTGDRAGRDGAGLACAGPLERRSAGSQSIRRDQGIAE